jgi:D-amino-acid dehydrogenase
VPPWSLPSTQQMRIAVIGAGLAGVTTAFELTRDGHEVIVYERRGSIAAEGSFAPPCVNAPTGVAAIVDQAVRHPSAWPWLLRARRAAKPHAQANRFDTMSRLALTSRQRLREIEEAHELDYEHHEGVLAVFRQSRHAAHAQALLAHAPAGSTARWLTADEARRVEPGLAGTLELEGAMHWPLGLSANGRQFAHALKAEAQRMGARFLFHQDVLAVGPRAGSASTVEVSSRPCTELMDSGLPAPTSTLLEDVSPHFDAAILCSATAAQRLAAGTPLPLCVAHVHSVTAPLRAPTEAADAIGPRGALLDMASGISIARLGERLRVAGRARWGHAPAQPDKRTLDTLYRGLDECFPGAARTARAQAWAGRQASFPDGLPAVGPLAPGVWANLGHGSQAWAWAPATARLCADLVGGHGSSLDPAPLDPARLR